MARVTGIIRTVEGTATAGRGATRSLVAREFTAREFCQRRERQGLEQGTLFDRRDFTRNRRLASGRKQTVTLTTPLPLGRCTCL